MRLAQRFASGDCASRHAERTTNRESGCDLTGALRIYRNFNNICVRSFIRAGAPALSAAIHDNTGLVRAVDDLPVELLGTELGIEAFAQERLAADVQGGSAGRCRARSG